MKSIIREELKQRALEQAPGFFSQEEVEAFIECIDKLPLDLVRQFLSRFLELKTTGNAIRLDLLAVVSQQSE